MIGANVSYKWVHALVLALLTHSVLCPSRVSANPPELVIYAYDSFASPKGAGSKIVPLFEKQCGCTVRLLGCGNGGQLLTRLQLDEKRGKSDAHLVLGLDQQTWLQAKHYTEPWGNWVPKGYPELLAESKVGEGFVPFDYGVFSLISDQAELTRLKLGVPQSLKDLLKPAYRRNVILEDPRTSTPGMAFLLLTHAVFGADFMAFWHSFKTQWLTLTPGWDGAYGLFLRREAPLVWSYTTSQAYHEEHGDIKGDGRRYRALLFQEGQPMQVEGAAMIRRSLRGGAPGAPLSAPNDEVERLSKAFLEFLISPEIQTLIAHTNWMLPVRVGVELPESYRALPTAKKLLRLEKDSDELSQILGRWQREVEHP